MKYKLFFTLILIALFINTSHAKKSDLYVTFIKEVKGYIDTSKMLSVRYGKYNVYCVNLYNSTGDTNNTCLSISQIYMQHELDFIAMTHYLYLDSEIVLLNFDKFRNDSFKQYFIKIDTQAQTFVTKKLLTKGGYISVNPEGSIICIEDNAVKCKFYNNAYQIPQQFNLFDLPDIKGTITEFPAPVKIEQINDK